MLSIWDDIERGRGGMLNPEGKTREDQIRPDPHASVFYNEADTLEDAVLFPEEAIGKASKAIYNGKSSDLEKFAKNMPDWE